MNVFRNDKLVLMKVFGNMQTVGETYEVGNITDTSIVLRDAKSKIAIAAIDINDVDEYFEKPENMRGWTPWQRLVDQIGNTIAFYRTNRKKVQVRTVDGYRGESTCNKADEFNLYFGLCLAMNRCKIKMMKDIEKDYEKSLNSVIHDMYDTENDIKNMIKSLD